ncbi:MAG: DUF975 family protein [Armatimonadota bacterium]|nr:DUF975 family protein [Armatimonadota bacterium]
MDTPRFSVGEAVRFGWDVAKRHIGFFVLVIIISLVVAGVVDGVQAATKKTAPFLSFLFGLASIVVGQVLGIGYTRISIKFADGLTPELADLWSGYPLFFKYLLTGLLYAIIVAVGLVLLVVPGVILAVRYSLSTYLVVDRGLGPMDALRASAELTQGARWRLFLLGLVLLGIIVLGALALVIGLLWAAPTALVAAAFAYRRLAGATASPPVAEPQA